MIKNWTARDIRILKIQSVVIFFLLVIVGVAGEVNYGWDEYPWGEPGGTTIAWTVSVEGDNYIIEIIDVQSEDLDRVSWGVMDLNRLAVEWEDPSGEQLRMEGDMIDVNFSQTAHDGADEQAYNNFYSQDPAGTPPVSINHTLCIVYMDVTGDGKLTGGDYIWIRSTDNGGCADEDYRFRLVNDRVKRAYGEKILPAV